MDANHGEIVDALRKSGWLVLSLASHGRGCPDLLCYRGGSLRLIEVKDGGNWLNPDQEKFQRDWPVTVIRTVEEALAL